MKTTIELTGFLEDVLSGAVKRGLARSKTDALRIAVFALNQQYSIINERQLVAMKIEQEQTEMKHKSEKYLTEDETFSDAMGPSRDALKKIWDNESDEYWNKFA